MYVENTVRSRDVLFAALGEQVLLYPAQSGGHMLEWVFQI